MDVAPSIKVGRTLVPVRFLANSSGVDSANISWDNPIVTLSQLGFPVVALRIGEKFIGVSGEIIATEIAPLIENGRTMLPARFVAEALGYQVTWLPEQRVVLAWPQGEPRPELGRVLGYLVTDQLPDLVVPTPEPEIIISEVISKEISAADGGTIIVTEEVSSYSAGFQLIVPSRALAVDTVITIGDVADGLPHLSEGYFPISFPISLEPTGLTFKEPVTIQIPIPEELHFLLLEELITPEDILLKKYDKELNTWMIQPQKGTF